MFGNMIYFDSSKVNEYKSIARGAKNIKINKIDVADIKGGNINLSIAGGEIKASKTYEATVEDSFLFDCNEFESLINERDDYFDFTTSSEHDMSTLGRGYIIKFDGTISVPEEFDLTQAIEQFKPHLVTAVSQNRDVNEQEMIKTIFTSTSLKIPVLTECGDCLLSSKLDSCFLKAEYNQLEEYEAQEVTILARILSNSMVSKSKAVFDPLKDFMALNRSMRRSLSGDRPDGLREIFCDEDYKNIEILAIYL